jgi:DNA repair protein RadC
MSILHWPLNERPRERLLQNGVQSLTDGELLAILLRHGGKGQSAVDIARELLKNFKGVRGILSASLEDFCSEPSLGLAKYCQLQAAAEIGRRCLRESLNQKQAILTCRDAEEYIISRLRDYQQEVFAALFLDTQHRVIQFECLFFGTINMANVYPREVAKKALLHNAAAMIVAHNHPSGIAEPSQSDQLLTDRLKDSLALIDVKLIDHLVIGDNRAISFAERGLL